MIMEHYVPFIHYHYQTQPKILTWKSLAYIGHALKDSYESQ